MIWWPCLKITWLWLILSNPHCYEAIQSYNFYIETTAISRWRAIYFTSAYLAAEVMCSPPGAPWGHVASDQGHPREFACVPTRFGRRGRDLGLPGRALHGWPGTEGNPASIGPRSETSQLVSAALETSGIEKSTRQLRWSKEPATPGKSKHVSYWMLKGWHGLPIGFMWFVCSRVIWRLWCQKQVSQIGVG